MAATSLINVQVLEQFQATEPDSDQFNLRLIEITAVAIHEISVSLFQEKPKPHDENEIHRVTTWQTPPTVINSDGRQEVLPHPPPKPILFYHYRYLNHENYPAGLADAAGYWAEVRIHIRLSLLICTGIRTSVSTLGGGGEAGSQYLLGPNFSDATQVTDIKQFRIGYSVVLSFLTGESPTRSVGPFMFTQDGEMRQFGSGSCWTTRWRPFSAS